MIKEEESSSSRKEEEESMEKATTGIYGGTRQKCRACDKRVYFVDQLQADGIVYHKPCFRCHHCKGTLYLSNYNSFEGVLYCKPHFDQLFKLTGSLDKSFQGATSKTVRTERSTNQGKANNRFSSMFSGTQDKCIACGKTVYPIEKVAVDGKSYHRGCFKCIHGGCTISPSNYVAHEHKLYCRHHHSQLIKNKGNFTILENHQQPTTTTDTNITITTTIAATTTTTTTTTTENGDLSPLV